MSKPPVTPSPMAVLRTAYPATGKVDWIGLRPVRELPVRVVDRVQASFKERLVEDRFSGKPGADRQVSLIQDDHLDCVAKMMGVDQFLPELTHRNIVISGINLTSLKGILVSRRRSGSRRYLRICAQIENRTIAGAWGLRCHTRSGRNRGSSIFARKHPAGRHR